jgi:DNA-binding NarL/FixJ family response regulator
MRPLDQAQPSTRGEGLGSEGTGGDLEGTPERHSIEVDVLDLTDREQAILAGLAAGENRTAVAEALGMSVASVDSSVVSALHKLHRLNGQPEGGE